MTKMFQNKRVGTLTDDAVKAKTGKRWLEWCKILDKAGARMMDHPQIAGWLEERGELEHWWAQMIAVGYEQERGLRRNGPVTEPSYQREVTVNKQVSAPTAAVWAAWQDPGTLARWLPGAEFAVIKAVPPRILHLDWLDETRVAVRLYERQGKTKVVVTHKRVTGSEAQQFQMFWMEALDRLQALVGRANRDTLVG